MRTASSFYECLAYHFGSLEVRKKIQKHKPECQVFISEYGTGSIELNELPAIETKLGLKLRIYGYPNMNIIYEDKDNTADNRCALLRSEDNTYAYVKWESQGALFNKHARVCPECDTVYRSVLHACLKTCRNCRNPKCEDGRGNPKKTLFTFPCGLCNRHFISKQCREYHFGWVCRAQRICGDCGLSYSEKHGEEHQCYSHKCKSCGLYVDETHVCFMQTLEDSEINPPSEKYIFYDIETCRRGTQLIFSCLVAVVFDSEEMHVFETMEAFMDWAYKNHPGSTLIAHYGGRFDMQYVKQWAISRKIGTHDIASGMKLSEVKIGVQKNGSYRLRLIDSFRFISIPLRAFAKTFALQDSKTFFPHDFYTEENRKYRGVMPDRSFFKEAGQPDFEAWYADFEGKHIDLFDICVEYCKLDVRVLQQGCLKFRQLFLNLTEDEVDPFQYLTIASTCMTIYRRFHMPVDTIPIQPVIRDREKRAKWLNEHGQWQTGFVDESLVDLTGEHFKPHAVDGETVYYMHSCVDVGCAVCFTQYQCHPTSGTHMKTLAKVWKETRKYLMEAGYEVIETKACLLPDVKPEEVEQTLQELLFIEPREAFYGGRTEPIILRKEVGEDEVIRYADYTSLYPSTQFCEYRGITPETYHLKRTIAYPKGHPRLIPDPKPEELKDYFGFIHCTVLVPEDEYMPVLPQRGKGKLLFPTGLLTGTWTTMQVQKAVERGAEVVGIYHVLHYDESTTEMWKSYVSTFLRLKQQAAGWKALLGEDYLNEEARLRYCADYLEHQGIELDPKEITNEKNSGMYFIAKICLNSLWGKFGQRDNFTQVKETFSMDEQYEISQDPMLEMTSVEFDGDCCRIKFRKKDCARSYSKNTSVPIAAFTTAYAQLRLYEALEVLGHNVMYMDTDSVIYVEKKNERPLLQMGPYLGDLTDELDGDTITEFVTIAPKTYAYVTAKGKESVRAKGFSGGITREDITTCLMNHKYVKLTKPFQLVIHQDHTIHQKVYEEEEGKRFRYTFNKRKVCEVNGNEFGTRPFKKQELDEEAHDATQHE